MKRVISALMVLVLSVPAALAMIPIEHSDLSPKTGILVQDVSDINARTLNRGLGGRWFLIQMELLMLEIA